MWEPDSRHPITAKELEHLYVSMRKSVFLFALSLVGDYALAEDVMQETFLKVRENDGQFCSGTNRKAWILTITRNTALNCLKKRRYEEPTGEIVQKIDSMHSAYDHQESHLEFVQALSVLTEPDRSIVVLHACCGVPHLCIASIVGLKSDDIRKRYSRAMRKLKDYYIRNR